MTDCTDEDRIVSSPSRYHELIELFGNDFVEKLQKVRTFLVGAGALGCEFLKFFALFGIGAQGQVWCTDNDSIEVSNLNRQFLFRNADVTHFKSEVACREAKKMNPSLNLNAQR